MAAAVTSAPSPARVAEKIPSVARALWKATQGRRAALRGAGATPARAWCGSLADRQTLLEGSVILEDDGDTEFVTICTEALPAAKFSAEGLLVVRLSRDVDGASARYTLLEMLIATSSRIWPGVLASRAGDSLLAASSTSKWRSRRGGARGWTGRRSFHLPAAQQGGAQSA